MERRKFVNRMAVGSVATALPSTILAIGTPSLATEVLRFGLVADVHKDLVPDANQRLATFIDKAKSEQVDFIVQLGDFCFGDPENKEFMAIWETFKGPKYHVLGNHDMDKNSKSEMLDFWGMPQTYYSWDANGFHFIVLDANFLYQDGKFIDYQHANFYVNDNYRTFIDPRQIEWFNADLEQTDLPTIVFSHQSLWHYQWGVKNRLTLQKIMESQPEKIICCMNGHNHIDFHHYQNGIHYIEVNSMSYQWMGDKYRSTEHYPEKYYQQYKSLPNIAPYKDPLYAFASLNTKGNMVIKGVKSQWVPPSPYDLGMPKGVYGSEFSAEMSDYDIKF